MIPSECQIVITRGALVFASLLASMSACFADSEGCRAVNAKSELSCMLPNCDWGVTANFEKDETIFAKVVSTGLAFQGYTGYEWTLTVAGNKVQSGSWSGGQIASGRISNTGSAQIVSHISFNSSSGKEQRLVQLVNSTRFKFTCNIRP
jgi:hypothetical protein